MSPPETNDSATNATKPTEGHGLLAALGSGTLIAVLIGGLVGALLVYGAVRDSRFAGRGDARIGIRINGLDERIGRDVLVPINRWVLQVDLPEALPKSILDTLIVTLREERTGAVLDITDRLQFEGPNGWLVLPESIRLVAGAFMIRAQLQDDDGAELVQHRRVRIRTWLGGPPIGSRQIIYFDFSVDRDGDGRPDFEQDLDLIGLASPASPELAARVARRIAERAVARVLRAYDPKDDPNGTGYSLDTVFVRFLLETEPSPYVTRVCVGGQNEAIPGSVGNIRFDARNEVKGSTECEPEEEGKPAAGIFPREFAIYKENALYRDILAPFRSDADGRAIGSDSGDREILGRLEGESARSIALLRAIEVLGDALGTVMAHESAHALGLVPPGRPGVGLFGGAEKDGSLYAHNLDTTGMAAATPWLMNVGGDFLFEDLAGLGEAGELRFRPLNHAYLKDRVVVVESRFSSH